MYTFKPYTDRVARLRDAVRDRVMVADASKARIQLDAEYKYANYPPILKRAYSTLYVMERIHLNIQPDEFFVGGMGNKGWGAAFGERWIDADIENTWPIEADGLHHAPDDDPFYSHQKMAISPEDVKALREIRAERMSNNGGIWPEDWLPDGAKEFFATQATDYGKIGGWPLHLPPGHLTPGYQNIISKGYGAIRKEAQDWLDSARLGVLEAVASGITTVADICRNDSAFKAVQEIGLRGIIYREVMTIHADHIEQVIADGAQDIERMRSVADASRIDFGMAPGALYASHPKLFQAVARFAQEHDVPVALHVGGSQEEESFVRYGSSPFSIHASEAERIREHLRETNKFLPWLPAGTSPVRYVYNWDMFDAPNVLAIHCVHVDSEDIEILRANDVAVAYCPRISAKLGMGMAPVVDIRAAGIRTGLGTDSPAAIDTTDMIDEMRFGLMVNRATKQDPKHILTANRALRMATIDGAEALRLEKSIGSLEVGKKADIIAVDMHNSHQNPTSNPESAVIYTANQDNVKMTMVGGRILYDDFVHISGVDRDGIVDKARALRKRVRKDFADTALRESALNEADEEQRDRFSR